MVRLLLNPEQLESWAYFSSPDPGSIAVPEPAPLPFPFPVPVPFMGALPFAVIARTAAGCCVLLFAGFVHWSGMHL